MTNINLVRSMVLTCCALHNLCEDHGDICENFLDMSESVMLDTSGAVADSEDNGGKKKSVKLLCSTLYLVRALKQQCQQCSLQDYCVKCQSLPIKLFFN